MKNMKLKEIYIKYNIEINLTILDILAFSYLIYAYY